MNESASDRVIVLSSSESVGKPCCVVIGWLLGCLEAVVGVCCLGLRLRLSLACGESIYLSCSQNSKCSEGGKPVFCMHSTFREHCRLEEIVPLINMIAHGVSKMVHPGCRNGYWHMTDATGAQSSPSEAHDLM